MRPGRAELAAGDAEGAALLVFDSKLTTQARLAELDDRHIARTPPRHHRAAGGTARAASRGSSASSRASALRPRCTRESTVPRRSGRSGAQASCSAGWPPTRSPCWPRPRSSSAGGADGRPAPYRLAGRAQLPGLRDRSGWCGRAWRTSSRRTRNAELTMAGGLFLTLPVLFLSSAFFPRPLLPGWLQAVSAGNPAAYLIEAGQHLMSTGARTCGR
ncbi:MAG TPA: ABC transporter permease [Streptosporangiaceae bacterium]